MCDSNETDMADLSSPQLFTVILKSGVTVNGFTETERRELENAMKSENYRYKNKGVAIFINEIAAIVPEKLAIARIDLNTVKECLTKNLSLNIDSTRFGFKCSIWLGNEIISKGEYDSRW